MANEFESSPPLPPPAVLEYQPPPDLGASDLGPPGVIARWFLVGCNRLGRFLGLFLRKD